MTFDKPLDISHLLTAWNEGEQHALSDLMASVYPEIRKIARQRLRQSPQQTLESAAVANEAYLRLIRAQGIQVKAAGPVVLRVDLENYVQYRGNVSDYAMIAGDPGLSSRTLRTLGNVIALADVVAVNGKPTKGTLNFSAYGVVMLVPRVAVKSVNHVPSNNKMPTGAQPFYRWAPTGIVTTGPGIHVAIS